MGAGLPALCLSVEASVVLGALEPVLGARGFPYRNSDKVFIKVVYLFQSHAVQC